MGKLHYRFIYLCAAATAVFLLPIPATPQAIPQSCSKPVKKECKQVTNIKITFPRLLAAANLEGRTVDSGFDLSNLGEIQDQSATMTAAQRIALGVRYLKGELANPSPPSWGVGGGPIDTGYIQGAITGAVSIAGGEDPKALRQQRNSTTDPHLKNCLTIALARAGAQDTIPDLIRIAQKDKEGSLRMIAVMALSEFLSPPRPTDVPRRLRPGEIYRPLNAKTIQAITEALLSGLQDTFQRYYGAAKDERQAYYPTQEQAQRGLRKLGLDAIPVREGWIVKDRNGNIVRTVRVKHDALFYTPRPQPGDVR